MKQRQNDGTWPLLAPCNTSSCLRYSRHNRAGLNHNEYLQETCDFSAISGKRIYTTQKVNDLGIFQVREALSFLPANLTTWGKTPNIKARSSITMDKIFEPSIRFCFYSGTLCPLCTEQNLKKHLDVNLALIPAPTLIITSGMGS